LRRSRGFAVAACAAATAQRRVVSRSDEAAAQAQARDADHDDDGVEDQAGLGAAVLAGAAALRLAKITRCGGA